MNREKMAKIAHFVLKICTNRFRDYSRKLINSSVDNISTCVGNIHVG